MWEWLSDAGDYISNLWDDSYLDQATSWLGNQWDGSSTVPGTVSSGGVNPSSTKTDDKGNWWSNILSGEGLLGGVKTLTDYYGNQANSETQSEYQDYLNQQLAWQRENAEANRAMEAEMQAAEAEAAKEIAAMQIEFQKQLAQYQGRINAQSFRADTTREGHGQTANAMATLASIAQRPFI